MSTSHLRPPSDIAISGPTDITVPKCNLGPPILTKRFGYKKNHSSKHPLFVSTPPLPLRSFADDMLRSGLRNKKNGGGARRVGFASVKKVRRRRYMSMFVCLRTAAAAAASSFNSVTCLCPLSLTHQKYGVQYRSQTSCKFVLTSIKGIGCPLNDGARENRF
ncbi:uncharacterized protein LOC111266055 isoform X1 [Varroa jacobsoni]|uniref:uncharacterized protein LOC111266055 isoform X1 n=1 Tax=Varroa jacobsoni TaxID=62625 RepID=UPI000BF49A15|nr:uncharacterized protein LOC111266055 isoform X1 [Varroa jacobsoni]